MLYHQGQGGCDLDGTSYHRVDTEAIPNAYLSVPVVVDDNGHEINTKMIAGLVGMAASTSGEKLDTSEGHKASVKKFGLFAAAEYVDVLPVVGDDTGLDTLQPIAGWFMYELKEPAPTMLPWLGWQ